MSETNASQTTFVDKVKALFTLDPRWHEGEVNEGDRDPRMHAFFERVADSEPIARTDDRRMSVCIDPDTKSGWLVTELDVSNGGTTRAMKRLDAARVNAVRHQPELLEHYKENGSWDESADS